MCLSNSKEEYQVYNVKIIEIEQSISPYEAINNMTAGKEVKTLTDTELQDVFK